MQLSSDLTLPDAHRILKQFDCTDARSADTLPESVVVKQALQTVTRACDYQIFGVCAETTQAGYRALQTYLEAMGYPSTFDQTAVEGPAYIKFNGKTGACYAEPYEGRHRGVVVSCQSAFADGLNETYGHLPLNLFGA
ncbi:DUF1824 family protein [Leptolyngbya sp. 'hensonii']|uniref:DUF1824 family protein n=1 Tax=Leptolyngbya sp. 'hensonii' TaxID=1922337 RepID=UPI000B2F1247|nr:DUF1824 family protein [Leptolyngbya sp. 'hensonii']